MADVAGAYILLLLLFSIRSGVIVVFGWKRQEERDWEREEERIEEMEEMTLVL